VGAGRKLTRRPRIALDIVGETPVSAGDSGWTVGGIKAIRPGNSRARHEGV